ncbi:L domain-like protein [Auriculariales sp. MPI-PUGE-AT-0066]|nr:L domain-like protein [Auriculariales sp. MPI-PUGE-AT-0066]
MPAFLFECHLGFAPNSLKDQPRSSRAESVSRYGACDLTMIRIRDNEIPVIPSEISYFGALAVLDAHANQLTALPASLCDLEELSNVDISSNKLTALPRAFANLANLAVLNIAYNQITTLSETLTVAGRAVPLPRLHTLDISHNPLGGDTALFAALAKLPALKELKMRSCDLSPASITNAASSSGFKSLKSLDAEENLQLEFKHMETVLGDRIAGYDGQADKIQVLVGKRIMKEKWEVEAEARVRGRGQHGHASSISSTPDTNATDDIASKAVALSISDSSADPGATSSTILVKWYDAVHGALVLPQALPARTGRGFAATESGPPSELPTYTLPVEVFYQEFSHNIRSLALSNRRLNKTLILPARAFSGSSLVSSAEPLLPRLEDLLLDGCGLSDNISLRAEPITDASPHPLFDFIATVFPTLKSLNLSMNGITSAALDQAGFTTLVLGSKLQTLVLRGNQLKHLSVLCDLAERADAKSTISELDVCENNIDRLDPRVALLPLHSLQVDGNTFRVPQRRVWETGGSAALIKWLKERLQQ